jgi:hypothetical protein
MFLYIPQFLSWSDHQHLLDELSGVPLADENNPVAPGRLRTFMLPGSKTHHVFTSPQLIEYFSRVFDKPLQPAAHLVPIEYRKYQVGGGGMKWHRDVSLIGRQYECVYTLTNTSDSQTVWRDWLGRQHPVWAEPNSLIVVQARGVMHGVSPVTIGERTIVKFVFCDNSTKCPFSSTS